MAYLECAVQSPVGVQYFCHLSPVTGSLGMNLQVGYSQWPDSELFATSNIAY